MHCIYSYISSLTCGLNETIVFYNLRYIHTHAYVYMSSLYTYLCRYAYAIVMELRNEDNFLIFRNLEKLSRLYQGFLREDFSRRYFRIRWLLTTAIMKAMRRRMTFQIGFQRRMLRTMSTHLRRMDLHQHSTIIGLYTCKNMAKRASTACLNKILNAMI